MAEKNWDSDWIHFSKSARRGVIVVLIIFIIVAVSPRLYYNFVHIPPEYEIQISPIEKIQEDKNKLIVGSINTSKYTQPDEMFNPNDYKLEDWIAVGLSEKQAGSVLKYLSSGAVLKVKSDLKKLYVVDQELYDLLESKIDLPDTIQKSKSFNTPTNGTNSEQNQKNNVESYKLEMKSVEVKPVSINTANIGELKKVPGIGPFYSKEIIKLRDEFGGFVAHDQLLEIFGMTYEKLDSLKPFLIIDENAVVKLDVNKASELTLRKHPLISYDMAKSIVYFRENYRPYKRVDEILLSPYINRDNLLELEPYLKVD